MGNTTNEKQWAAMERLCFIERAAFWQGWVNRGDLMEKFGLSSAHASSHLQKFQELNPGALVYTLNRKRYEGAESMVCCLHEPRLEEAIALFLAPGVGLPGAAGGSVEGGRVGKPGLRVGLPGAANLPASSEEQPGLALVALPLRVASATVLRAVFRAVMQGLRLRVDYQTMSGKAAAWRWIVPHAFAHDGYRWHVRAWSESGEHWGDFVLSRIRAADWPTEAAEVNAEKDTDWQTWVDLALVPNSGLTEEQQATIKSDYGMRGGKLKLRVRRAMLDYTLAHLRLPMMSGNAMGPVLELER